MNLARRAIQMDPDDPLGYQALGNLYALNGQGDRAIEMRKLRLLENSDRPELQIYYLGKKGDKLELHVHGLKDGEIGVSRVPLGAYDTVQRKIRTNWLTRQQSMSA